MKKYFENIDGDQLALNIVVGMAAILVPSLVLLVLVGATMIMGWKILWIPTFIIAAYLIGKVVRKKYNL